MAPCASCRKHQATALHVWACFSPEGSDVCVCVCVLWYSPHQPPEEAPVRSGAPSRLVRSLSDAWVAHRVVDLVGVLLFLAVAGAL